MARLPCWLWNVAGRIEAGVEWVANTPERRVLCMGCALLVGSLLVWCVGIWICCELVEWLGR